MRPKLEATGYNFCGKCKIECPDFAIAIDNGPPAFDLSLCLGCTKCRDACAPKCINLTEPEVRVMLGGKLGRHPHLAERVVDVKSPEGLVLVLEQAVEDYLKSAMPEERFADFWLSSKSK